MTEHSKQVTLIVAIVLFTLIISFALIATKKSPEREERITPGPLVEVINVTRGESSVAVTGHGTVRARVRIQLIPQVSGRVVSIHPGMVEGGFFKKGEPLVTIDPTDYTLALQQTEAEITRSQVQLDLEVAEAAVARTEWEKLYPGESPPSPLIFRETQVNMAKADMEAAMARMETARLNLERTRVDLPFDGRVVTKSVGVGQFVSTGQSIATVYGTDSVEIPVPLEDSDLAWFHVPRTSNGHLSERAEAFVSADFSGVRYQWKGRVARTEGEIDPITRMVRVVIEVEDPFKSSRDSSPLIPGMFVDVEIRGKTLKNVISLPRYALHEHNTVWVVEDGVLNIRSVEILRKERDRVYVSGGLDEGDSLAITSLDVVTDGMNVRIHREDAETERGEAI